MISGTEWEKRTLAECTEIISGGTPKTSVDEYWDGEICWATPKDLSELSSPYISNTPRKVTQLGLEKSSANILPEGSVLFSSRAPIGHVAINTVPMATNQGFKSFIPDADVLDAKFLYWWLRSHRARLEALGNGATFKEVSKAVVSKVRLPLPPLEEQKRIAEVLDRAEALRARRRAALSLLDELTQSIFLDMFGDPVTNPEGWPIRPIVELAENKDSMRVPIKQSDRDERSGKYPYYGSVGIIDDIDDFIYEGPHLLISEDGKHLETRNRPIACLADGQFWVNNHAHVLAANGNAELVFLAFNLEMRPLHQFVTGIDQFKLNRKSMDKIPVAVPPIELQQEFAQRIRAIEDQKSRFEAHLGELGSLFASLQSRAFKGELFGCSLEPVAAD